MLQAQSFGIDTCAKKANLAVGQKRNGLIMHKYGGEIVTMSVAATMSPKERELRRTSPSHSWQNTRKKKSRHSTWCRCHGRRRPVLKGRLFGASPRRQSSRTVQKCKRYKNKNDVMEAHFTVTKHLNIWQEDDSRGAKRQLTLRSFRWQQISREKKNGRTAATHTMMVQRDSLFSQPAPPWRKSFPPRAGGLRCRQRSLQRPPPSQTRGRNGGKSTCSCPSC